MTRALKVLLLLGCLPAVALAAMRSVPVGVWPDHAACAHPLAVATVQRALPLAMDYSGNRADGSFGLSKRERTRLSRLRRQDEPLEEELRGLALIGAIVGVILLGGPLGILFGYNAGPLLGLVDGEFGEKVRLAGWEVEERRQAFVNHPQMASLRRQAIAFDQHTGFSTHVALLASRAVLGLQTIARWVSQWWNASETKNIMISVCRRTGIYARWKEFRERQVLNARVREARLTEFYQRRGGQAGPDKPHNNGDGI